MHTFILVTKKLIFDGINVLNFYGFDSNAVILHSRSYVESEL